VASPNPCRNSSPNSYGYPPAARGERTNRIGDPSLATACKYDGSVLGPVLIGVAACAQDLSWRDTEVRFMRMSAHDSQWRTGPSRPRSAPESRRFQDFDEEGWSAIPGP
jgi:hypothetical protein